LFFIVKGTYDDEDTSGFAAVQILKFKRKTQNFYLAYYPFDQTGIKNSHY